MHRIFHPVENLSVGHVEIADRDEVHHLRHVLRLKKGSPVKVFTGAGQEGEGVITALDATAVAVDVQSVRGVEPGNVDCRLTLACAIPKNAKFEYILEKCTELDVAEIIPLQTERSNIVLKAERARQKLERYRAVVLNATRQSQRLVLPVVQPIQSFKEAVLNTVDCAHKFIPWLEGERVPLSDAMGNGGTVVFIGPEGDFSSAEVDFAKQYGFQAVSLGPLTLKVDTAAIAVAAFFQFQKKT